MKNVYDDLINKIKAKVRIKCIKGDKGGHFSFSTDINHNY